MRVIVSISAASCAARYQYIRSGPRRPDEGPLDAVGRAVPGVARFRQGPALLPQAAGTLGVAQQVRQGAREGIDLERSRDADPLVVDEGADLGQVGGGDDGP